MKKKKIYILVLMTTLSLAQPMTVLAVTESDVRAVGKEAAAGNLFIWFLCAIAFLKISQKIDSFLSSLGTWQAIPASVADLSAWGEAGAA